MDFRYELSIKLWQIPPRTCLCHQNSIFSLKVKSAFTNLCIKYRVLRSCVGSEALPLHYFFNLLCFGLVVSKSTCELNTLFFSLSFAMIKQPKYGILSMENTSTMPFFGGGDQSFIQDHGVNFTSGKNNIQLVRNAKSQMMLTKSTQINVGKPT